MEEKQAFNPFLPEYEYIPDGEPHVFGDRVYVYGSHDKFGAPMFCVNDYVCWSASVDDLKSWSFEGVIYRKRQDPKNRLGLRLLFAPDVARGKDGRYYLYYAFDFMGMMGVAVSDRPCGPFQFYGHVCYPEGEIWGRKKEDAFPFDPGIFVDDDGKVYLYSGFYTPVPSIVTGFRKLKFEGGYMVELQEDMKTIKKAPIVLFPKKGSGAFQNHEFFEASSMRKINGKYYFIYSSRHNHEICYAVGEKPDGKFEFGGTLVSNGDLFLNGNTNENHASNYIGNIHGSILQLKERYYVFYHRHTNRSSYARQACAEELVMRADGSFEQAEMTSCGLNGGPLKGNGRYEARIACNLWANGGETGRYDCRNPKKRFKKHPYFPQDRKDGDERARQYIANMQNGAMAGFKYFEIKKLSRISVCVRGNAKGKIYVSVLVDEKNKIAEIPIESKGGKWKWWTANAVSDMGIKALYFQFEGDGNLDFLEFELEE